MNAFEIYKHYLKIRLHFKNDNFDLFLNKGAKCSPESFERRRDKKLFFKLQYKFKEDVELTRYIISNFMYGNDKFLYNDSDANENLLTWKTRKESISKVFSDDINITLEHALTYNGGIFKKRGGADPLLYKLYTSKKITPESMIILNNYFNYLEDWLNDPYLDYRHEELMIIKKGKKFVRYEDLKIKGMIIEFLEKLNDISLKYPEYIRDEAVTSKMLIEMFE